MQAFTSPLSLKQNKRRVTTSLGFALFWVYGTYLIMTFLASLFPLAITNPVASFFGFIFGSVVFSSSYTFIIIFLNNLLIFFFYLFSPFNLTIPFSGFVTGCVLSSHGFVGATALSRLISVFIMPFAFFEFGAYILAASVSFYFWQKHTAIIILKKEQSDDISLVNGSIKKTIYVGAAFLLVAAILEVIAH